MEENENLKSQYHSQDENHASSPSGKPDIDDQGFFMMEPALELDEQDGIDGPHSFSSQYASPGSKSRHSQDQFEGFEPARGVGPSNQQFQKSFQSSEIEEAESELGANGSEGLIQEEGEPLQVDNNFEEPPETDNSQFSNDFEPQNVDSPHAPSDRIRDEKFHYSDEKKMGIEKDQLGSDLDDSKEDFKEELAKSDTASSNDQLYNDIEPIDTSCTRSKEYEDNPSPNPSSLASVSTNSAMESRGRRSPAMRGAHEILKRNRRRRAES